MDRARSISVSLLVAAALGSTIAGAAPLPPGRTPIRFLPGDGTIAPVYSASQAALAAGGGQTLIVWTDARPLVLAARLDASGALLDSIPLVIADRGGAKPRVAWNGESWLVAWEAPGVGGAQSAVVAARVSPAGIVLDPVALAPFGDDDSRLLAVATLGTEWAVVAQGGPGSAYDVRGRRISGAGELLGATPPTILPGSPSLSEPFELAGALDEYLLVWNDVASGPNHYRGIRLRPDLSTIDASPLDLSRTLGGGPSCGLASDGNLFFFTWPASDLIHGYAVRALRISHAGAVTSPTIMSPDLSTDPVEDHSPRAAWDGTHWWVAYTRDSGINVTRVTSTGYAMDPAGIVLTSDRSRSSIAGEPGGGLRVVWPGGGVNETSVSADGVPGNADCVSFGTAIQSSPALASGTWGSLVAFASDIGVTRRIFAHPLDAAGGALLAEPVAIAAGPSLSVPSVAWNGSLYLVTWGDRTTGRVYAKRVMPGGTVLDGSPIDVLPGTQADVAAVGGDFLVVGSPGTSWARRVRGADGALLDPSPILVGYPYSDAHVVALADGWIVGLSSLKYLDGVVKGADLISRFVGPDGSIGPNRLLNGSESFNFIRDLAASPDTALVVWWEYLSGRVRARRVLADGSVLDGPGFLLPMGAAYEPRVVAIWDGREFMTAFEDGSGDILCARIDGAGTVLDPTGAPVFTESARQMQPALSVAGTARVRAACSFFRGEGFAAYRIALRDLDVNTTLDAGAPQPRALALAAAPNPARGQTVIQLSLPVAGPARVGIFDVSGRRVRWLLDGVAPAGRSELRWDGRDASGRMSTPGVYLLRVDAAGTSRRVRIVRL